MLFTHFLGHEAWVNLYWYRYCTLKAPPPHHHANLLTSLEKKSCRRFVSYSSVISSPVGACRLWKFKSINLKNQNTVPSSLLTGIKPKKKQIQKRHPKEVRKPPTTAAATTHTIQSKSKRKQKEIALTKSQNVSQHKEIV